eukprot:CAMPEP_0168563858 /NCGR_PEP_ID=MMETSP0413-20121227/12903_1 /TAXON_ID=136452 /ORGANISM="Filamoeba nolandi, Strain NC-AS-23-1" /LENGTH=258 /DNA_ID=CAMNT_0008595425 /DNA_START=44 /DNA_END=817 /DNA_ORIENTATION=-
MQSKPQFSKIYASIERNFKDGQYKTMDWMVDRVSKELPKFWKENLTVMSLGAGDARNDLIFSEGLLRANCSIRHYILNDKFDFKQKWDQLIRARNLKRYYGTMDTVHFPAQEWMITLFSQSLHTSTNPDKVLQETTWGSTASPLTFITENGKHPFCSYLDRLAESTTKQVGIQAEKAVLPILVNVDDAENEEEFVNQNFPPDNFQIPQAMNEIDDAVKEFRRIKNSTEGPRLLKLADMYCLLLKRRNRDPRYDPVEQW